MSNVVYFTNLPINSESSFVRTRFDEAEQASIKEIYTNPGGIGNCAWVVFKTDEDAERAATKYHERQFGPVNWKSHASLSSESSIPKSATNTLTKFLHDRDNQIESRTIEIKNLPETYTLRSMKQLFEIMIKAFESYVPDEDADHEAYEPNEIVHMKAPKPGVGLVQMAKQSMAINVVREFAGTYWKNATLNLRCVPDKIMEDLLAETNTTNGKAVNLFVTGIKPGSSSKDIQNIFKGYKLRDINLPPGGKNFCFVFAYQDEVDSLLDKYGQGFNFEGRFIRVSVAEKGKKKGGNPTYRSASSSVAGSSFNGPTTDLKVNNLPYRITDATIHNIFDGFSVSKVVAKEGFAYVGIASDEAERAVEELDGKRVGDMNISVKLSERRRG